jgi:mono/diheme cytochrome c family protein
MLRLATLIAGAAAPALLLAATVQMATSLVQAAAVEPEVARGKYLVTQGLCTDCHTPGFFLGKPDASRYLGGSDVGFEVPGLGTFYGRNLTPDRETGIGAWTREEIVTAIQTGARPDGRILAPIMPWRAFANLTRQDAMAIAAYLKSLPPVKHKVIGPFGPSETPTGLVMKIVPPPAVEASR